jgi:hypothetical protein
MEALNIQSFFHGHSLLFPRKSLPKMEKGEQKKSK